MSTVEQKLNVNVIVTPYQVERTDRDLVRSWGRRDVYQAVASGSSLDAPLSFYRTNADTILTSSITPWAETVRTQMGERNLELEKRNNKLRKKGREAEVVEIPVIPTVQEMRLERADQIFTRDVCAAWSVSARVLKTWIDEENARLNHLREERREFKAILAVQAERGKS